MKRLMILLCFYDHGNENGSYGHGITFAPNIARCFWLVAYHEWWPRPPSDPLASLYWLRATIRDTARRNSLRLLSTNAADSGGTSYS